MKSNDVNGYNSVKLLLMVIQRSSNKVQVSLHHHMTGKVFRPYDIYSYGLNISKPTVAPIQLITFLF